MMTMMIIFIARRLEIYIQIPQMINYEGQHIKAKFVDLLLSDGSSI